MEKQFNPNKGQRSKAAKQAFKDMMDDDITIVQTEMFGILTKTHMILTEKILSHEE